MLIEHGEILDEDFGVCQGGKGVLERCKKNACKNLVSIFGVRYISTPVRGYISHIGPALPAC